MPELFPAQVFSSLVVLDLEWNQKYGRQQGNFSTLPQEVVEIGAVKLDGTMRIVDQFQATVRPVVLPVLHRHVQRVTGISAEECRDGEPFAEAGEAFMRFCGTDCSLVTWGPDDYPVLSRNLGYWSLPQGWLTFPIDAQKVYSLLMCAGKCQQVGLQAAMEALGIAPQFPSHRALHDAFHTALVLQKLDPLLQALPDGDPRLPLLKALGEEHSRRKQERSAVQPTEHRTVSALMDDKVLYQLTCPRCDVQMTAASSRMLAADKHAMEQYATCAQHGLMHIRFQPQSTATGFLSMRTCITPDSEPHLKQFLDRCAKQTQLLKRRRRSRVSPKKKPELVKKP